MKTKTNNDKLAVMANCLTLPAPNAKTLTKWAQMTDGNFHGEVREQMARWFQGSKAWKSSPLSSCRDYLTCFKYINAEHEARGSMPYELLLIRNVITNAMLDEIRKFDVRVGDMVNGCL